MNATSGNSTSVTTLAEGNGTVVTTVVTNVTVGSNVTVTMNSTVLQLDDEPVDEEGYVASDHMTFCAR